MSLKAVGYVRVSIEEQQANGYSMDNQRARIQDFARAKGWTLIRVYEDGGYSAKNLKRPGIMRLIRDVRAKRFDIVIVHKLDRLSQSQRDLWNLLDGVFKPNRVDFVSVTEAFDTSTASGKLVLGILGTVAQWERKMTSERITEIARRVKAQGRRWGKVDLGYKAVDGKLTENPGEQKIIHEACRLRRGGKTLRDIRQSLKEMGRLNRKGNGFSLSVFRRMVAGG